MVRLAAGLRPLFPYLKAGYTAGTRAVAPFTTQLSRARGGHLPQGVAMTMEDAAEGGGRLWIARPEEIIERPVPDGMPPRHPAMVEASREVIPRVAVLELPGGRVLGSQAALVTGDGRLVHELSWYFGTKRPREHPLFLRPFPPEPVEVPGRLGVLATRGDVNYYHFLHDSVARLGVLQQCPEVEPPDRWYVRQDSRFQREILDLLGIPPEQRIDAAQVPHVRAEQLVVPGLPSNIVRNPPWVGAFLRDRLGDPSSARVPGRHLYLTRGASKHNRAVLNEDEVLAALEPLGFTAVDPGALGVADQVRTFAEADVVVAPHGAALANLVFCSPGATIVEVFPQQALVADYWKMASGVPGLGYRYLSGRYRPLGRNRHRFIVMDITVDVPQLLATLDEVLATG